MPRGEPYATTTELKAYLKVDSADTTMEEQLDDALATASEGIEDFCHRQFNQAEGATAITYYPSFQDLVIVDDFHTTTDLMVELDTDDDGTFEVTMDSSDLQPEPVDGIRNGRSGWPFWKIRATGGQLFPGWSRHAPIRVTAQWGWVEVPASVHQACLIIAAETVKLADAPFGVAGFGDFGVVRVRNNPIAASKLNPYRRYDRRGSSAVLVG